MSIWQSGTFYIGETWVISGHVRDANGIVVDLTGATIQLRITLSNSVIFDLTTPTDGAILHPPTAGGYLFEITPDQQTELALTTYRYEVRAVLANGTITVQSTGEITVVPSRFSLPPLPPPAGGGSPIVIGSTHISGGAPNKLLYDDGSVVQEAAVGTGLSLSGGILSATGGGGGGSGNGGGLTSVATIGALAALVAPANGAVAVVSDPLQGGAFIFSTANHATDVSHDPGAGITVPPASDPTGGSGAWIRQYQGPVRASWWGVKSDGVVTDPYAQIGTNVTAGPHVVSGTDNTQALTNWQAWQCYQTQSGNDAHILFDPGVVLWSSNNSTLSLANVPQFNAAGVFTGLAPQTGNYTWLQGIKNLTMECANGVCAFQNTFNISSSGAGGVPVAFPARNSSVIYPGGGYKINQTTPGSTTFTVVATGDLANFSIGETFLMASLDVQFGGGPFNAQYYEYHKIIGISGSTVTVANPIEFEHRADYPDYNSGGFSYACGKARMWKMSPYWDARIKLINIQGNSMVGYRNSSIPNSNYVSISSSYIETKNWRGLGFAETMSKTVIHRDPVFELQGEIDKLVESITIINGQSLAWGLVLQSPCPKRLTLIGGHYAGMSGLGLMTVANGVRIDSLQLSGGGYGYSSGGVFNGCEIASISQNGLLDGASSCIVDGAKVTYSNGVITIDETTGGSIIPTWGLVPGQTFFLDGFDVNEYFVTNYSGSGMVKSITETGSPGTGHIVIATDLPWATLPAWVTTPHSGFTPNQIRPFKVGQIIFNNCFGGELARQYSRACANNGTSYYEYQELVFANPQAPSLMLLIGGEIMSIEVDVSKPGNNSAATFNLTIPCADCRSTAGGGVGLANDASGMLLTINHGIEGKRIFTQQSIIMPTGASDSLTLSGIAQTKLPAGRIGDGLIIYGGGGSYAADYLAPTYTVKITTNGGTARKGMTMRTPLSGGVLGVVQGPIP